MGIQNRDGALYFATGMDTTGLHKGKQEVIGIIKSMAGQITSFDIFGGIGVSAGIAFAQAAKNSYDFSKEFDKNMREVMTISSAVSGNFEGYKEQVIKMTTEIPVAATESAKALYQIVSAGHDGAAGMKILEASAKAAIGGVTETATAADAITTLINAYKLSADDAGKVSDELFMTAKLGKTTFGELGQSIAQVAPIASAYGVEMEQVLAAVATLTKSGTPTAQAMTQIRASIIGVSKYLGDGAFATRTFQEALREVAEEAGGSESALRGMITETEAITGILGLTGIKAQAAADDLDSLNSSVGATEDAYKKMAQGTDAQLQLLQNNVIAYLRPMGEEIMKTVSGIAGALNEAFGNGDAQAALKLLGELLVTAAGAFIAYKTSIIVSTAAKKVYMAVLRQAVLEKQLEQVAILNGITLEKAATASQLRNIAIRKMLVSTIKIQTAALLKNAAALLTNPYVLATAAIVSLGYSIYKLTTYTTDAEKAMRRVADANKEFEKSVASEQITIDRLFGRLKAATEGTKEYENAKKAIIAKYGQYLDGLDSETKSLKNVEAAYRAISEAAIQSARDRAIEAATAKASDTYEEGRAENMAKIKKLMEEKFGAMDGTKYFLQLRNEIDTGKGLSKEMEEVVKSFEKTKTIATPGGRATTYQFNDVDVYISKIRKGKEVFKTEMKEIDAVMGSATPETPKSLEALNSELEISRKKLEDLKRVRPGLFTDKEIADQEAYIAKIRNSIKALEDQNIVNEKKNAEAKKTVEWYDAEIKKLKELQGKADSSKGYKNDKGEQVLGFDDYQKKIKELEKGKESITGKMSKDIADTKKAYESLGRVITESELKLQEDQLAVMEEGKSKRLAQSKLEYDRRQIEIQKEMQDLDKQYKDAGKGGLTDADKKRFSDMNMTNDAAWKKRDSDINDEYTKQIEEHTKALADVFVSEEQRKISAIQERYRQEKEWADKQLKGGGMNESQHSEYIIKINEAEAYEQMDSLLEKYKTFAQQLQEIEEESAAEINTLKDARNKAQTESERKNLNESIALAEKAKQAAISNLKADELMKSADWSKLFGDVEQLTARQIGVLTTGLREKAQKLYDAKEINAEAYFSMLDRIGQAEKQALQKNPFLALATSAKKVFSDIGDKSAEKSEKATEDWQDFGEAAAASLGLFAQALEGVGQIAESLGVEDQLQDTLDAIVSIASGAGELAAGIASGNIAGMITGSVNLLTSVFNAFNKDKKHEKKIQSIQKEVGGLERAYDSLGKAIDKSYSSQKVGLIDQQEANLKKQQELLKQQIAEEEAKKKTDQGKIDEWKNQIEDLNEEIAEMKDRRIEAIMGKDIQSAIDDFANAYAEAWAAGEDKRKAIKDVVRDMIKGAVKEMIKMRMNPEVTKLMEFLSTAVTNGIDSTEQGIIDRMTENIYQAAEAATKGLEQFLDDPEKDDEAQKEAGLAGAVRREMTEETASELTGLFRSYYDLCKLQLGVNTDSLDVHRACLLNIQDILKVNYMIEHNTARMVEEQQSTNDKLGKVEKRLGSIESNTKPEQSARALGY